MSYTNRLARRSDDLRQAAASSTPPPGSETTCSKSGHPLVRRSAPKVRFVVTADDVIPWWVPALGWKQDATSRHRQRGLGQRSTSPGIYRGQCAEGTCGKDHGFMPVVVKAVTRPGDRLAAEEGEDAPTRQLRPRHHAPAPAAQTEPPAATARDDPNPPPPAPPG